MSIEELEHTADLRFRVRAPTLEELFGEALRALMETMYGETGGPVQTGCTIAISAADRDALLHDFLSEALYLAETDNLVFSGAEISIVEGNPWSLQAILRATPFDTARHSGGTEVKGIAYFDLSIAEVDGGFRLDIVFDV